MTHILTRPRKVLRASAAWLVLVSPVALQAGPPPQHKSTLKVDPQKAELSQITKEKSPIKFSTVIHHTLALHSGSRRIVQHGHNGEEIKVFRIKNGKRTLIRTHILRHSQPEIIQVGVAPSLPSRGYFSGRHMIRLLATKYRGHGGLTATGIRAKYGVVAVDPRIIPLGTRLYIPGYGYAIAADTGGAIKGRRIDLCIDRDHMVNDLHDRGYVDVYILN